jgi:hypothetical protein
MNVSPRLLKREPTQPALWKVVDWSQGDRIWYQFRGQFQYETSSSVSHLHLCIPVRIRESVLVTDTHVDVTLWNYVISICCVEVG